MILIISQFNMFFSALLVLSSHRSGGSSLGFRELVAFRPEALKNDEILKLWPANVKKTS